jgi:3-phenylpropionate/trans-cinnamate dioxygenase ferredoxin reductase subunit
LEREQLFLKPEAWYDQEKIDLHLGTRVDAIDRDAHCIRFGDDSLAYDHLILATGSLPRRLPEAIGGGLDGVHTLRDLTDIDALAPQMQPGRRLVIVGGGYIGLEAAAVARKLGLDVTLIEAAPRILQRVASPETAEYIRKLHISHGVKILQGMSLERLLDQKGRVNGVLLFNGDVLAADLVIVGIGIVPATSLAEKAGLAIDNGIAVDEYGRTSDPAIWAAGDCASFPTTAGRIRLESVGNAIDQAKCIAANIAGTPTPYVPKPWFWSDQYDVKLQIAGLNTGYDHVVTRPGNNDARSFWYLCGERLLAVDAANDPGAYMAGKRIIEAGKTISPEHLTDTSKSPKDLLTMATDPD